MWGETLKYNQLKRTPLVTIQTDTSDTALLYSTRANICDLFRLMSTSHQPEHFENNGITRWRSVVPHSWFNGLIANEPPSPAREKVLAESLQYFQEKQVKEITFWVDPAVQLSDWSSVMSKYGFVYSKDTPGMALDLNELNTEIPNVDGLEIRVVEDVETCKLWSKVFTLGYGLPSAWEEMVFKSWGALGLVLPMRNYLGYLDGKPVATSCLFLGGGAAGMYSVSTVPEARGKGIGAVMTVHPLLDAREMDYRIGTLQSSDMGFKIYQRLGFQHICQIEYFHKTIK